MQVNMVVGFVKVMLCFYEYLVQRLDQVRVGFPDAMIHILVMVDVYN